MLKFFGCALCAALAFSVAMIVGTGALADDNTAPVSIDRDQLAGVGLPVVPGSAYQDMLESGQLNFHSATVFRGKDLNVSVFEATPSVTNHIKHPTGADEFVYVLSGKLILTEANGAKHEYHPGDALVVPAGYTGKWEMQGNYREIAVEIQKRR